ncbi:hypothetical protein BDY24DRAFT_382403 [Mrakia frigida]|uniref:uncharacterized protein n=1 Tax=Mrakia frigida TaxID=29902 RepID=UPI003FCBFEBD
MPPLATIQPPRANNNPPPTKNNNEDGDDSDSDSMPELVDATTTFKSSKPIVKPPSALDKFSFSSAFPSLAKHESSAFPLPALPSPEHSPLRRSLASLPVDVLHSIGWFLLQGQGKDVYGFEKPSPVSMEVVRLSGCCRTFYGVLRKEMYRYLEIRGDDRNKAMLQWIKGEKEIASWVRYVEVTTLCPRHQEMIPPIAEAVPTFINLTHFAWLAHSSIPPTIASALVKSPNLVSMHLWRHAIGPAFLLHGLNLVELKVSQTRRGDDQCDEMVDAGTGLLQGGTFEENQLVYDMRGKRDLSAFRGLIEAYQGTLERICFESEFRSLSWMETVIGAPAPDPPTPPPTPSAFVPPPPTVLPLLALPRLQLIKFPSADLTSPTFHHLLETSPEIRSLYITHLPQEASNEVSPTAPDGTLQNLTTLHYRGGRRNDQSGHFPVREGLESFLNAGDATRVEDLEIQYIAPLDLQSILLSANFSALTTMSVALSSAVSRPLLQLIVRECPNLQDFGLEAPKWPFGLVTLSALLRPLKKLTHFAMDHSIALTTERCPIPQAEDLILHGTYPSEVSDKLERYVKTHTRRWANNFLILAEENHKLETITWQASDEVVWVFTVGTPPPLTAEEVERAYLCSDVLPMHPLVKRRYVKLVSEARVELGSVSRSLRILSLLLVADLDSFCRFVQFNSNS